MNLILAIVAAAGVAVAADMATPVAGTAKITSDNVVYDRKNGWARFLGHVYVDDEKYQLHADEAWVVLEGTNELKKVVAIGNVALTNDNRRAYGARATYYRNPGRVVISGGEGDGKQTRIAELRENTVEGERVLRGRKIKFWIDSQQVEVEEPEITAPSKGIGNLKDKIGR